MTDPLSLERLLTFERAGRAFAIPAIRVHEILPDRPLERVPLAPLAIAGIVVEHGRSLTVIELDRVLRIETATATPTHLVALAPPFSHLALRVHGELRLESREERSLTPEEIDVEELVQALEAAIAVRMG